MANKFQKSVLERLEQEKRQHKQTTTTVAEAAAQEKPPAVKSTGKPEAKEPARMQAPTPTAPPPSEAAVPVTAVDLSRFLHREPQRIAKNKTFYLDTDVIDGIRSAAKAQGVTDSKLVNDVLRAVLGLGK